MSGANIKRLNGSGDPGGYHGLGHRRLHLIRTKPDILSSQQPGDSEMTGLPDERSRGTTSTSLSRRGFPSRG